MQKKEIKVQIKKESKLAKRSLRGFLKKGDQEKLHKFRVGIKKLRAVASLIEETTALIHVRNELKPVKETYQLSGKVRDSYLHVKLAQTLPAIDKEYFSNEITVMKKAARKLRKDQPHHFKMLRRAKGKLVNSIPRVKDKKVSQFYERELQGIGKCLSLSTEVKQMHDCRKRLKVLLYNLPLVGDKLFGPINEDYIQRVQTAIGDWHDHVLAAEQFPELGNKSDQMMQEVKTLTEDFYERATTVAKALIEKKG
jgi:CHAD domain-containing protein